MTAANLVDPYLQNISTSWNNGGGCAAEIAKPINVPVVNARIAKYNLGDSFRNEAAKRAPGTESALSNMKISYDAIHTEQVSAASEVFDEDIANAGLPQGSAPPVNLKQDAIEESNKRVDRYIDVDLAALIKATDWNSIGAGGEDADGGWGDTSTSSTFLVDINTARALIHKNSGYVANRLAIDFAPFEALRYSADILDMLKYTSSASLTEEILARLLGLEKVVVCSGVYSSAIEKADGTDFTASNPFETNAGKGFGFVYYAAPTPTLKSASALLRPRTPVLTTGLYRATFEHPEPKKHKWTYEVIEQFQHVVGATQLGYHFKDTFLT